MVHYQVGNSDLIRTPALLHGVSVAVNDSC